MTMSQWLEVPAPCAGPARWVGHGGKTRTVIRRKVGSLAQHSAFALRSGGGCFHRLSGRREPTSSRASHPRFPRLGGSHERRPPVTGIIILSPGNVSRLTSIGYVSCHLMSCRRGDLKGYSPPPAGSSSAQSFGYQRRDQRYQPTRRGQLAESGGRLPGRVDTTALVASLEHATYCERIGPSDPTAQSTRPCPWLEARRTFAAR
jgi:hypothetical protein